MPSQALIDALRTGESFIVERFRFHASQAGLDRQASVRQPDWLRAVSIPHGALLAWLEQSDSPPSEAVAVGIEQARRHRARGVRGEMFLGLFKLLRQAFLDQLERAALPRELVFDSVRLINRFFDTIENSFTSEWLSQSETALVQELQLANRKLTNEKNRYQAIFECISEPAFAVDHEMHLVDLNAAAERFFQVASNSVLGRRCHEVWGHKHCGSCPLKRAMKERSQFTGMQMEVPLSGVSKTVLFSGSYWESVNAPRPAGIAVLHDITGIEQAHQALLQSELKYRSLFDNMQGSCVHCQELRDEQGHLVDGVVLEVNRAFEKLTGLAPSRVIGSTVSAVLGRLKVPPEDPLGPFAVLRHSALPTSFPYYGRSFDKWLWINIYQAEPGTFTFLIHDITELKLAEKALAEEKERLAVTLASLSEAVLTVDMDGAVQFLNPVAEQLTGWSTGQAQGKPLERVFSLAYEKGAAPCHDLLERLLDPPDSASACPPMLLQSAQGTEHVISYSSAPVRDARGEVQGLVLVFRDETARRRLDAELQYTQRLESLGVLAGGIAHDYNNILAAILAGTAVLKLDIGPESPSDTVDVLSDIESACQQGKALSRQLMTFSKGGAPLSAQSASIAELLRQSCAFALRGTQSRARFALPSSLWPVDIDPNQISQVLQNVVINAAQAMPEGGILEVRARNLAPGELGPLPLRAGPYVQVSLQDQGMGIAPEHLAKVFDPYFTTKPKGNGLGLSVVYSTVRRHQGHVRIESQKGLGTTVHLYLPAAQNPLRPIAGPEPQARRGQGRVLLMDDQALVRKLAARTLSKLGYQVTQSADGQEAIACYEKALQAGSPFDAVLVDLTVAGGLGGTQTVRKLRELNPQVKVIVCSGYVADSVVADFPSHGFSGVLVKPFTAEQLSQTLEKVLRRSVVPPLASFAQPPGSLP